MAEIYRMIEAVILCHFDLTKIAAAMKSKLFDAKGQLTPRQLLSVLERELTRLKEFPFKFDVFSLSEENKTKLGYYTKLGRIRVIEIREDIYESAAAGNLLAMFIICHEIAHWILLDVFMLNGFFMHFYGTPMEPAIREIMEDLADLLASYLLGADLNEVFNKENMEEFNFIESKQEGFITFAAYYKKFIRRFKYSLPIEKILSERFKEKCS